MQISKKIYTTLIIALLILSTIVATIPVALAIGIPTLSDTDGNVGDDIDVDGAGATNFGLVEVFWDSLGNKIGEGYADGAGNYGPIEITIPEDVVGFHDVIVKDDLDDTVAFSTFEILPDASMSAYSALPGDSIDVTGTGFGSELPVGIYLGAITSVVGEVLALSGTPAAGALAEMPAVIGTVSIDVDVTVDGDIGGTPVTNPGAAVVTVTDDGEGVLSGTLAGVVVDDGGATTGLVDVTITGTINYNTGAVTLVASGVDGGGAGTVINIDVTVNTPAAADYDYAVYNVTPMSGAETSTLGSVDEAIVVPAIPEVSYGPYVVTVIDFDGNSDSPFLALTVDYYILVMPPAGPAGITVMLMGRIPASTSYEIRLDTTTIATGISGADTTFTEFHTLSSFLSLGAHTFYVVWDVTETKSVGFSLTESPQVTFTPTSGYVGDVVTISSLAGYPFSPGADIFLYVGGTLVNSTPMDDRFGPTGALFAPNQGHFADLEFSIPDLDPGVYTLEVEDEFGASTGAIYTLTILATPTAGAMLLGTEYYQGDTLSFSFISTDTVTTPPTVTIRDPASSTWWTGVWPITVTGPISTVLYQNQLFGVDEHATLPNDAPLGTWNWTITWTTAVLGDASATGLFTVSALPTTAGVETKIDDLETTLLEALDEISGEITDITGDVATIKTDVGQIETTVDNLDISELSGDLATIKSNQATLDAILGQLVMDVADLDATVTSIEGDVATVDTALGTLQGTVTAIEGNTATIETDVGTLQADVTDVKGSVDSTPAWIAVVLSLVAAIAAIFAVITIRQKIAG
jgi:hypothetical protein